MTRHFSSREISEYLSGCKSPGANVHLANCAACREELKRFRESLAQFRSCVREWSEEQMGAEFRLIREERGLPARIGMALLIIALIILMIPGRNRRSAGAITDAALLEQVNRQVSQEAPRCMEPLLNLLPWRAGSREAGRGR